MNADGLIEREAVAGWMIAHSYATGHGDTLDDLLRELIGQAAERAEAGLRRIVDWAEAYPLEVFPEPDLELAREGLESVGLTLDAVSASAMRHVIAQAGKIAREALEG